MTLHESFDELMIRAKKAENSEKYHHLMISPDKSEDEESILKLTEKIKRNLDMLDGKIETNWDVESIKLNTARFLKNLEELFDKNGWASLD